MGLVADKKLSASTGVVPYTGGMVNASGVGTSIVGRVLRGGAELLLQGLIGKFGPPAFPTNSLAPGGGIPEQRNDPREGVIMRTVSQLLPGGKTGHEWQPVNDMKDKIGRPLAVYPAARTSQTGPAGYVMVTMNGHRIAMLKGFAIRGGLYHSPPKPPVSGYDMRAITRAASAAKRVRKLATKVGFACHKRGGRPAAARPFGKRKGT